MMPAVFLSHNWQDKNFARKLASDLMQHGVYVWIDEAEIQIGDSLIEKIRKGIDTVDYLIVILSPDSVKSGWVKREVDIAMNQEINHKRVKVLPVMYRSCELPWFLEGKLYADFTNSKQYRAALRKLLVKLGVKTSGFHNQFSIFQSVESLLRPLVKEVNNILSTSVVATHYKWNDAGPLPNEDLVKSFEILKKSIFRGKCSGIDFVIIAGGTLSYDEQKRANLYQNSRLTQKKVRSRSFFGDGSQP